MTYKEAIEYWRNHLDTCKQCRDNPLRLCPLGIALLKKVVDASDRP